MFLHVCCIIGNLTVTRQRNLLMVLNCLTVYNQEYLHIIKTWVKIGESINFISHYIFMELLYTEHLKISEQIVYTSQDLIDIYMRVVFTLLDLTDIHIRIAYMLQDLANIHLKLLTHFKTRWYPHKTAYTLQDFTDIHSRIVYTFQDLIDMYMRIVCTLQDLTDIHCSKKTTAQLLRQPWTSEGSRMSSSLKTT